MAPPLERSISPPATKRRKLDEEADMEAENPQTSPDKNEHAIRIFSWNINGVSRFVQSEKPITDYFQSTTPNSAHSSSSLYHLLRTFLRRHRWPEILFLQEVQIRRLDVSAQRAVKTAVNRRLDAADDGPDYEAFFTLPRDKHNAKGKVYGVCSIVRQDFYKEEVAQVKQVDWDLEGRVSVIETVDTGKHKNMAIFNIYAVNGTNRPYRDPTTGKVTGSRHDHKLAFHHLLLEECKQLHSSGYGLVLAGDFNVARDARDGHPNLRTFPPQHCFNRADFNLKYFDEHHSEGLKAIDAWRAMRGDERRYTYFPRGKPWGSSCDRVDLVIVTSDLVEDGRLLNVGIEDSPQERGPSDHVPIWVKVSLLNGDEGEREDREDEGTHAFSESLAFRPKSVG